MGAFAVFAFTRMFASPIRPRTMTKEWQEASEEYLKVCHFHARTFASALTQHSRKAASPSPVTRECWFRASPRRTCLPGRSSTMSKDSNRSVTAITMPIPIPHFPCVNFPFGTVCVTYNKIESITNGCRSAIVIIVLIVQKSRGFSRLPDGSPLRSCARRTLYDLRNSQIKALYPRHVRCYLCSCVTVNQRRVQITKEVKIMLT